MYIYHSTLSHGTNYVHAVSGNFSNSRFAKLGNPELIVSRNRVIEMFYLDKNYKRSLVSCCLQYVHYSIRGMTVLRWKERDFLVIAADTGHTYLLFYSLEHNMFLPIMKQMHALLPVTLPDSPGEYVAAANGGIFVGGMMENHHFISLGIDSLDINVPLDVQSRCVMYDLVGIQSSTAAFFALEVKCEADVYDPSEMKSYLRLYEADLYAGEFKTQAIPLPEHANKLIYVPEGKVHPDGIIICYEDSFTFKPFKPGFPDVKSRLPQRESDLINSRKGIIFQSSALYYWDGNYLVLAQTEQGDLFSILLVESEGELTMNVLYMDTIPVSSAMCVVNGFLFVAAEFGDNFMYDVQKFGDVNKMIPSDITDVLTYNTSTFENLGLLGCQSSLSPLLQSHVFDFAHNNLKLFVFACGYGSSSTLRYQRYGVKALYKALLYEATLDKTESCLLPNSMWIVRGVINNKQITFIVFSHPRGTIVLALEDAYTVIDCDVAFNYKLATLNCVQCTSTSFIQVYHTGFRYIVNELHKEFKIKRGATILQCAVYYHQIAVALVNKEGMYFEVTEVDGNASFRQMPSKLKFNTTVMCMQFVPRGFKANQLVVCFGDCLKIYQVDITRMVEISTFNFKHSPASMTIVSSEENVHDYSAIINIGFQNGVLQRITLHQLHQAQARIISEYSMKLGTKPVKLRQGVFGSKVVIFVLTNRPWVSYYAKGRMLTLAPLDFKDEIYDVAFLSDEPSPRPNVVALSNNKDLYILSVSHHESLIEDAILKLNYTPSMMIAHPGAKFLVISGTDKVPPFYKDEEITAEENLDFLLNSTIPRTKYDETSGVWDSILHVFDPIEMKTVFKVHLPKNEVSTSMCLVQFKKEKTQYILVGAKQSLLLEDGITTESFIYMYEVSEAEDGTSFTYINKTIVKDVPYAICQIKDFILIGIGKMLCLYSFNHSQKILARCAFVLLKEDILSIWSRRKLFIVKTSKENIVYGYIKVVPKPEMFMLHEDRYMRGVSCLCFWDDDIIFVGNKRRISAVILPYYEGCEKSIDPDIKKLIEKMEAVNLNPSTFAEPTCSTSTAKEPPHSRGRASTSKKAASSTKEKTSTSKKRPAQSKERASASKKRKSRSKDTTSTVSKSSHSRDTVSKGSSHCKSTSRKRSSTQRFRKAYHPDKMSFKMKDPAWKAQLQYDETSSNNTTLPHASPWGSRQNEMDYCYPYARFMKYSHVLVTHDVKEIVQTVQKAKLVEEGRDLIIYTTVCGAVGVLVPFLNETLSKVLQPLQFIINHHNPLFNNDWLFQIKHRESSVQATCEDDQVVIDGNLLSLYRDFAKEDQIRIANYLQRSPFLLNQKIEDMMRTKYF